MIKFSQFNTCFLDLSYKWLQDKELCTLINCNPPTKQSQREWYDSLEYKTDYKIFGVTYNDLPIGVWGLKHITSNDAEYFGYIGDKQYWGKGIGKELVTFIENKAKSLGIKNVYLNVIASNVRAYKLYTKMNYKVIESQQNEGVQLIIMSKLI